MCVYHRPEHVIMEHYDDHMSMNTVIMKLMAQLHNTMVRKLRRLREHQIVNNSESILTTISKKRKVFQTVISNLQ